MQYLLTAVDSGTDQVMVDALPQRSSDAVIILIQKIFSLYGKPISILTNNGEEFRSYCFEVFLHHLGIKYYFTLPYHPQTNGRVKRFNHELIKSLHGCTAPSNQN
jgi:transposase InsO family protein